MLTERSHLIACAIWAVGLGYWMVQRGDLVGVFAMISGIGGFLKAAHAKWASR